MAQSINSSEDFVAGGDADRAEPIVEKINKDKYVDTEVRFAGNIHDIRKTNIVAFLGAAGQDVKQSLMAGAGETDLHGAN